jgi:hypothetical protein
VVAQSNQLKVAVVFEDLPRSVQDDTLRSEGISKGFASVSMPLQKLIGDEDSSMTPKEFAGNVLSFLPVSQEGGWPSAGANLSKTQGYVRGERVF